MGGGGGRGLVWIRVGGGREGGVRGLVWIRVGGGRLVWARARAGRACLEDHLLILYSFLDSELDELCVDSSPPPSPTFRSVSMKGISGTCFITHACSLRHLTAEVNKMETNWA